MSKQSVKYIKFKYSDVINTRYIKCSKYEERMEDDTYVIEFFDVESTISISDTTAWVNSHLGGQDWSMTRSIPFLSVEEVTSVRYYTVLNEITILNKQKELVSSYK